MELSDNNIRKLVEGRFLSLYVGKWQTKGSKAKAWQLKAYERAEDGRRKQLTLKTKTVRDKKAYTLMKDIVELYTAYMHILKAKEILKRYKDLNENKALPSDRAEADTGNRTTTERRNS